jgi:hypothetical protein
MTTDMLASGMGRYHGDIRLAGMMVVADCASALISGGSAVPSPAVIPMPARGGSALGQPPELAQRVTGDLMVVHRGVPGRARRCRRPRRAPGGRGTGLGQLV